VFRKSPRKLAPAPNERAPEEGRTPRDLVIILGWQALLAASLSWLFGWWGYFVMWWIPVYVFTFAADVTRVFCEHAVPHEGSIALHERLITFEANILELALFAPMNMNHHAAHHLWPAIPYYNLPQATADMGSNCGLLPGGTEPPGVRRSYTAWLLWRLRPGAGATT